MRYWGGGANESRKKRIIRNISNKKKYYSQKESNGETSKISSIMSANLGSLRNGSKIRRRCRIS